MKQFTKRMVAMLVAVVMLIGCMSFTAFAADGDITEESFITGDRKLTTTDYVRETEHFRIEQTNSNANSEYYRISSERWIIITSKNGEMIKQVELLDPQNDFFKYVVASVGDLNSETGVITNINSTEVTLSSTVFGPLFLGGLRITGASAAEEDPFVTTLTFSKDYNDSFAAAPAEGEEPTKTTAPKETLTFAIAPVTANAPALPATVTMNVENGAGEAEIAMPTTGLVPGSYWYKLTETGGHTAGVTYDDTEYYLHLIVGSKGGVLGVKYATIHTGAPADDGSWQDDDKIDTITNAYGEGSLSISQTVSGNGAEDEDEFTVTVTLTLPENTVITTDVVLDNGTVITPDMWNNGTVEIEIPIHGGETVTISGIPAGISYEVEQTETNEDIGYTAPEYTMEEDEDPDATDGETNATGTIGDKLDKVLIENEKNTPVDVGVILENGAYVTMALGAIAAGAFLVISRKKKYEAE